MADSSTSTDLPTDQERHQAGRLFSREFRDRVRRYYGKKGGLLRMAHDTGVAYSTLWHMANSLILPGEVRLRKLCKALNWSYAEAVQLYPQGRSPRPGRPSGLKRIDAWIDGRKRFAQIMMEWKSTRRMDDTKFCSQAGITFSYYHMIQRARCSIPSMATIGRICKALGKKPHRLVFLRIAATVPGFMRGDVLEWLARGAGVEPEKELIAISRRVYAD